MTLPGDGSIVQMPTSLLAFAAAAALLTITPGADTALVLRISAVDGRRAGLAAVAGIGVGVLSWGVASGAGLATVLLADPVLAEVLGWAGAAYLVLLGLGSLRTRSDAAAEPGRGSSGGGFRRGLLTNLLNPKIGAFYLAFLPQFIPAGAPVLAMSAALAGLHVLFGTVWLSGVVLLVHRARALLHRDRVRRVLQRLTGAVLIGFGLRLALHAS